eukprot:GFYU01006011.1.p1 GENE.GFYU01006011.1~~GFYU01006011.1.p1  ORF type:complete len:452 (-),score=74.12 GFYU01006011.1:88-1443(-)
MGVVDYILHYVRFVVCVLALWFEFWFRFYVSLVINLAPYIPGVYLSWKLLFGKGILSVDGSSNRKKNEADMGTIDLIRSRGYPVEEYYVVTSDGYVLTLHRIPHRPRTSNATLGMSDRPVVVLQHGFMQSSEIFVAHSNSLPFLLVDGGCDVWLPNMRGNKYSSKHREFPVTDTRFWQFSLDEIAQIDIPACINRVLEETGVPSVTYIGFDQGATSGMAGFSFDPRLSSRVNAFIALAPALRVHRMYNHLAGSLMQCSASLWHRLFGHKALLSQIPFWKSVLSPPFFAFLIDSVLYFVFGWKSTHICPSAKKSLYPHLYSSTSVKVALHWAQIYRTGRFQMFDADFDRLHAANHGGAASVMGTSPLWDHVLPLYDPSRLNCPVTVIYGDDEEAKDMEYLISLLPPSTTVHKEDYASKLEFLWADDVSVKVNNKILATLTHLSPGSQLNSVD